MSARTSAVPALSAPTDWVDRVLDLEVGPVAHGGHCVARSDGRVVFVRHVLPGERVRAVVTEDGGGAFCRADAIAVLEPSAARVPAPCAWARPGGCGGCDFQHVEPARQRELKAAVLAEQLWRLAGIDRAVEVAELPGGPLGRRHRVRLVVDAEGRAGLRAHRSHDVLAIADCPLVPPDVLPPVLAATFPPGAEVQVTVDADGEVHVDPAPTDPAPTDPAPTDRGTVTTRSRPIVQRAAGREWRLSPGVFWQVHPALPDALARVVGEWAAAPEGGTAWDLYGGVGLFAAVLAGQVGSSGTVCVVESSRRAVADGRAALADLPQVRWTAGRVDRALGGLPGGSGRDGPDVVVTDPPRSGLGRAVVDALCVRAPDRVVHLACDPAALARDVGLFEARGYQLTELTAFDAFPMTHHLEAVALLVRT